MKGLLTKYAEEKLKKLDRSVIDKATTRSREYWGKAFTPKPTTTKKVPKDIGDSGDNPTHGDNFDRANTARSSYFGSELKDMR